MTNDQFMEEVNAALLPIIKKYAIANGADKPETLGFHHLAAGIGLGAGLDKNTTISICIVGAMNGYEEAAKEK